MCCRDRDPLAPAWVHDMAATDDYVIICEMPLHFHMPSLLLGGSREYGFMDWRPETGTRIHVVPLDGSRKASVRFMCACERCLTIVQWRLCAE